MDEMKRFIAGTVSGKVLGIGPALEGHGLGLTAENIRIGPIIPLVTRIRVNQPGKGIRYFDVTVKESI